MINASKEKLAAFFQGNLQLEIPFFQRAYVWDKENWQIFWDHIYEELRAYENQDESEHFIGTIITKQKESTHLNENIVELVDGQQRLTTISILLKAIADTCNGDYVNLRKEILNLLSFEDSRGDKHYRIIHNRLDKPHFESVIDGGLETERNDHPIIQCYQFYVDKVKGFSDERRDHLKNIILKKVPVISMLLNSDDDEQEIFDTINSLGVRLTTGELLKNYIFKHPELREDYDKYWGDIFEADSETFDFWNEEKTSGRIKRDNIEVLLYCFLIIRTKSEVIKFDKLFKEYKKYLKRLTVEELRELLIDLAEMAESYREWPQEQELEEIAFSDYEQRFFHVLENFSITTIYPLVLYIYKSVTDEKRKEYLYLLESYMVRRQICKLTTKNYNRLFVQIIQALEKKQTWDIQDLKGLLTGFDKDTNRNPADQKIREAFENKNQFNRQAKEILFLIALKGLDNNYSDNKKLASKSFSVEHIMPKKWAQNWKHDHLNDLQKHQRNEKLKTMGNLTLITKNLNSKLRNQAWKDKRNTLKEYSSIKITRDYLELPEWDENTIDNRAKDLATRALEIWSI